MSLRIEVLVLIPCLSHFSQIGDYTKAVQYAEAALSSMQLVAGGFHPALGPYFQLLSHCMAKAGDEAGAERIKKSYLKMMVQFKAADSRAAGGPSAGAAGGASKPSAAGAKGKKKGGK